MKEGQGTKERRSRKGRIKKDQGRKEGRKKGGKIKKGSKEGRTQVRKDASTEECMMGRRNKRTEGRKKG